MTPSCGRIENTRGICTICYYKYNKIIKLGQTTWESLEKGGLVKVSKTKNKAPMKRRKVNYETLLQGAPDHMSPEFIKYLRDNNKVVHDSLEWLIIENTKYHTKENPWHTAFYKGTDYYLALLDLVHIPNSYRDWKWLKKPKKKQSVLRYHIHLIK